MMKNYFDYSIFSNLILLLLILCFFAPSVSALLISPAVLDLEYEENGIVEFDVTVVNDISQDIIIVLSYESFEGKIDYTEYFTADGYPANKVPILSGTEQEIHFTMTYPELEKFGDIRFAFIRFYQVPYDTSADVGATVALLLPIDTVIPYPEKYVKVSMEDFGTVAPDDSVPLEATLTNLGQQFINNLDGYFVLIKDETTKTVPFDFGLTLFLQNEGKTVTGTLDTNGMETGKYDVFVYLNYDGETKESSSVSLIIGEKSVEVLEIYPETFEAKATTPVTITLLNLWTEDVSPAISLQLLSAEEKVIQSSYFGIYTLPVTEEKKITGNLNLEEVGFGVYTLRTIVNLDGEEIIKDFPVTVLAGQGVAQAPEWSGSLVYIVGFALLTVILLLVIFFFWYRKNNENN